MSIPKHLGAFDGQAEDYEWTRLEPLPAPIAEMQTVLTPTVKPTIYWGTPEFDAAVEKMYRATRTPEWQAEQARKLVEKQERKRAREARLAELRQR